MKNHWVWQQKKRQLDAITLFIKSLNPDFVVTYREEKSKSTLIIEYKNIPVMFISLKRNTWWFVYALEKFSYDDVCVDVTFASQGFWWLLEWFLFYSLSVFGFGDEKMHFRNDAPWI